RRIANAVLRRSAIAALILDLQNRDGLFGEFIDPKPGFQSLLANVPAERRSRKSDCFLALHRVQSSAAQLRVIRNDGVKIADLVARVGIERPARRRLRDRAGLAHASRRTIYRRDLSFDFAYTFADRALAIFSSLPLL